MVILFQIKPVLSIRQLEHIKIFAKLHPINDPPVVVSLSYP